MMKKYGLVAGLGVAAIGGAVYAHQRGYFGRKSRTTLETIAKPAHIVLKGDEIKFEIKVTPPVETYGFKAFYTPSEFMFTPDYKKLVEEGQVSCGRMYDRGDDLKLGPLVKPHWIAKAGPILNESGPLMCGAAEGVDLWTKEIAPKTRQGYVFAPKADAKDFFFPSDVKRSDWILVAGFDGPDAQGHGGKWAFRDNFMVDIISQKVRTMTDEQLLRYMQSNEIHTKGTRLLALIEHDAKFYSMGTNANLLYHYTGIPEIRKTIDKLSSFDKARKDDYKQIFDEETIKKNWNDRETIENNMVKVMTEAGKSGREQFKNPEMVSKMASAMYERLQASACLDH